jgi:hypothetical protein
MIKKNYSKRLFAFVVSFFAQEGTVTLFLLWNRDVKRDSWKSFYGGVAVEQDSIHINLQNPASFANLKWPLLLSEERIIRRH